MAAGGASGAAAGGDAPAEEKKEEKEEGEFLLFADLMNGGECEAWLADHVRLKQRRKSRTRIWALVFSTKHFPFFVVNFLSHTRFRYISNIMLH